MKKRLNKKIDQLKKALKLAKSEQIFCKYYSPGTFFTETSSFEVEKQDVKWAAENAKTVSERYNAKPFGFRFTDGNGKALSGLYYITGKVITYDDVPDTNENNIWRSNMRCNDMPVCIENTNSYRYTGEFQEEDCIVDWDGEIIRRGDDSDLVKFRKEFSRRDFGW